LTTDSSGGLHARLLIDGAWCDGATRSDVHDKFHGGVIGRAEHASKEQVDAAVAAARRSFETAPLAAHARHRILVDAARLLEERAARLADTIVAEAGFPYVDAENEVKRAAQTLTVSAEEGKRLVGEMVPIETVAGHEHRLAFTIRVPRGVVCGITSFNSPLNMVAHKVAPALASGNTIVLKAAHSTPFSATHLAQALLDAGLPPGHVNLVQGGGAEVGGWLVANPDVAFYSFTGSTPVGKRIREGVGLRPVALELGSIAAVAVFADADLDRAATRCAQSAFRRAGQACTSVQRLFVERSVHDAFVERFLRATKALKVGDPHDRATVVGPLISERDAVRAQSWVDEAVAQGARVLCGGTREGSVLQPTVLAGSTPAMRVLGEEIFAPVVSVLPFDGEDEVVARINATRFGLACGVFTRDAMRALGLARRLHVGVVHINEPSSSRVDLMPFAGVKESGVGTEGPRYAMREMTEERLVTASLS
jgi:acyl-CoA reductase-like NAD-dependent aldehyde dehydrogenase